MDTWSFVYAAIGLLKKVIGGATVPENSELHKKEVRIKKMLWLQLLPALYIDYIFYEERGICD
jgi:hypothetical protein